MPVIKRKVSRKVPYLLLAVLLFFFAVGGGVLAVFSVTLGSDKIYKGVTITGVDVGGMTVDEAQAAVSAVIEQAMGDQNIDLVFGGSRHSVDLTGRLSYEVSTNVDMAYAVGRSGDWLGKLSSIFSPKQDIALTMTPDEKFIRSKILTFAQTIEQDKSAFMIAEDTHTVEINLDGAVVVDAEGACQKIIDNAKKLVFEDVTLPTIEDYKGDVSRLLLGRINREPENASCEIIGNRPVITDEKVGVSVSLEDISAHIQKGERRFTVPFTPAQPEVTRKSLEASMFTDVLGEFTTAYNESNAGRTKNVVLSAQKINGAVIASGDNFSFNRIVGERTYAKGYADANVYVGGRIEQGVGGGICQVVSTLYSAQLYADLQTVSRQNHQFTVSYLPLGQDATVAWASIDYVFKNSTSYPIKIVAVTGGGKLTIRIVGTKPDKERTVKIITQTISVSQPKEIVQHSSALPAGKTVVDQPGQTGAVVDTYKAYYRNGVEEERVFIHRSTYHAMNRMVTKSSAAAPDTATGTPAGETDPPEPVTEIEPPDNANQSGATVPDEFTSDNGL